MTTLVVQSEIKKKYSREGYFWCLIEQYTCTNSLKMSSEVSQRENDYDPPNLHENFHEVHGWIIGSKFFYAKNVVKFRFYSSQPGFLINLTGLGYSQV